MTSVGDRVRKIEGRTDLGREGVVTFISPNTVGGDRLVQVDGDWTCYDRQLELVETHAAHTA